MTDAERQLLALLQSRCFRRGEFRLASGDTSTYYIDGKMAEAHSASAYLIGQVLYERTRDLAIDGIGGLAVGAVPLTTAAVIAYHLNGREMEGFWVRDEVKAHGTQKRVEGLLKPGARVAVVDDVITRGTSSVKAIQAVREAGAEVVRVLALVDRLVGAREQFRALGIDDFQAIFTIRDFGVEVEADRS
jgi:orotate phosphoribosyltransferase